MGLKGTKAAKEAAEMVLADDNFATIAHAIEEGRTIYENIRKTLVFALPTNGAQAGVIVAAVMAGTLLPLTPLQVLWVNLVTAVTLALALAFEPPESDVMRQPPRNPRAPLLAAFQVWRIAYVSILMVIGTLGMFLWEELHGLPVEAARTLAVNTLIVCQCLYLVNCRFMVAPSLTLRGLFGSRHVLGAIILILAVQLLFTYAPFLQRIFGTAPISAVDWVRAGTFGAVMFLVVEIEKSLLRRYIAHSAR
jgi:magnesium-transporting ATPase (P-type)